MNELTHASIAVSHCVKSVSVQVSSASPDVTLRMSSFVCAKSSTVPVGVVLEKRITQRRQPTGGEFTLSLKRVSYRTSKGQTGVKNARRNFQNFGIGAVPSVFGTR